jgi:hypothetical protein
MQSFCIEHADIQRSPKIDQPVERRTKASQPNESLLRDAMEALELVLEEGGLTFASEQAADSIITRIKKTMG